MATEGYCVYCGAQMWRDSFGRVHARNPEPGCPCSMREDRYTVDRPMGGDTWYLWDGDPDTGEVVATGDLSRVLKVLEERA